MAKGLKVGSSQSHKILFERKNNSSNPNKYFRQGQ